jgi:flavin-dependent dehydrogenase
MRVAIIGNGIVANLGALYFRKRLPAAAEIILVGPDDRGGLPVVGESLIEITGNFLENRLGLGQYLRRNHYPKFGLTYYFKIDPENPQDRTYSVHGTRRAPQGQMPLEGWDGPMVRPPSWQLNRETFDRDIRAMVAEDSGVTRINGLVSEIHLNGDSGHQLLIKENDGGTCTLETDWVIDTSGRKQLLARKLDLVTKPEGQRDCFWFRLADFDRSLLQNLDALGPPPPAEGEPYHHDRYFTTHHFMGRGNWIWMIPLQSEDGSELMSIGLVSHPDVYEHDVRSVEDFIEQVGKVHPVVADFVKSGRVVDTNLLRGYHYVSSPVYSADRWGIVGDAAFAPDPMFSNGLAFCTIQLEQLGQLIAEDCEGALTGEFANELSEAFMAPVLASQTAITNWYKSMDDAYLSSLRLTWIEVAYYYMLLPMVINRCHYDPDRLKLWKLFQLRIAENGFEIPKELLDARALFDTTTADLFLYKGEEKVNSRALDRVDDLMEIQEQIIEGAMLRSRYVQEVLARIEEFNGHRMENGN